MPNYHELLGIPPNASLSDIEAAYQMHRRHAAWRGEADPAVLAGVISIADSLDLCPKEADGALQRDHDSGKVLCVAQDR